MENNYDRLDKYIRRQLEDASFLDQKMGSKDHLFAAMQDEVNSKKERSTRLVFLWWIIPIIVSLGFMFLSIRQFQQIDNLQKKVGELTAALEGSNTLKSVGEEVATTQETKVYNENASSKGGAAIYKAPIVPRSTIINSQIPTNEGAEMVYEVKEKVSNVTTGNDIYAIETGSVHQESRKEGVNRIQSLLGPVVYEEHAPMISMNYTPLLEKEAAIEGPKVGLYAGMNTSRYQIKGMSQKMVDNMSSPDNHTCISLALQYQKPISQNWVWNSGISYERYESEHMIQEQLLIDLDEVYMLKGTSMYNMQMIMPSPLGDIKEQVSLRLSQGPMITDKLDEELKTKQVLDIIQINSGLGYKVVDQSKWNLILSGHLGLGYNRSVRNDVEMSFYVNNKLVDYKDMKYCEMTRINPFSINTGLQIESSYYMGKGWYIDGQLGYNRTLNSLRIGETNTYLNSFVSRLGVSYRFGKYDKRR